MPPSFRLINYDQRPGKHIERKMMAEAFSRLNAFQSIDAYRYVGFGSIYFTDFTLFHRALGITDMVSIEIESMHQDRFNFNRPFGCIDIQFGKSTSVLPKLDWTKPTIVWLDYDGSIELDVLADIRFAVQSMQPGSVVAATLSAYPDDIRNPEDAAAEADEEGEVLSSVQALSPLERLRRILPGKIPSDIRPQDAEQRRRFPLLIRRLLTNEIASTVSDRNGGLTGDDEVEYRQLFFFTYADGKPMVTVGGIIYDGHQHEKMSRANFSSLDFIRDSDEPYVIEVPNLTYRELRFLDRQLPAAADKIEAPIPPGDLERYAKVYRHFPTFAATDV